MKRLKEMELSKRKEQITGFLTYVNKGYGNILNKETMSEIYIEFSKYALNNDLTDMDLNKIYYEMANNYKKYLPLCYFAIITAYSNTQNNDKPNSNSRKVY